MSIADYIATTEELKYLDFSTVYLTIAKLMEDGYITDSFGLRKPSER